MRFHVEIEKRKKLIFDLPPPGRSTVIYLNAAMATSPMQKKNADELLKKYLSGTCSEEERALLEEWYQELDTSAPAMTRQEIQAMKDETWKTVAPSGGSVRRFRFWYPAIAAAIVAVVLAVSALFFGRHTPEEPIAAQAVETQVAVPGSNKAILSLADGTTISLMDAQQGKIAEEHGVSIRKTADGQIVYDHRLDEQSESNVNGASLHNQISTPRGGQYQVTLPDGTKVWLNAASSLKYPVKFSATARQVELTGEAYFEVRAVQSQTGARVPFLVVAANQAVEVLGTRFNINSYTDETSVRTTLLEGSVRVTILSPDESSSDKHEGTLLKADQQAVLTGNNLTVKPVNAEEVAAWMKGYFSFEHADIKTIMRQVSRWYDLEVVYEGQIPASTFSGKVDRNMDLSSVLEILAFSEVNFRVEGKRITIFP